MSDASEQKPAPQVRHDWYQTHDQVVVSILLKNADESKMILSFGPRKMFLSCLIPNTEHEYKLELLLAHEIDTERCSKRVAPSKIEVKLHKKELRQWLSLEGEEKEVKMNSIYQEVNLNPTALDYPSSAIKKTDWDGLVRDIKKEEKLERKKPMKLCEMFKRVYAEGDEEMQRAMNRSFMESGGTMVSANWKIACGQKIKRVKRNNRQRK